MPKKMHYKLGPDIDLDKEIVLDSEGQRITEHRAKEMAEHALEQAQRGRPSLTARGKHSPQISFRVPEELARRASDLAHQRGKSLSQLGREALESYVESRRGA